MVESRHGEIKRNIADSVQDFQILSFERMSPEERMDYINFALAPRFAAVVPQADRFDTIPEDNSRYFVN